ncbi:unnamed protein product [Allacma fusca]|uniref:Uncharacterized protein n=1 Tax=Allacma fusca TaxID=39272 RepID=A0A8J2P722_9HEXA|nr:unnamed protein product [Allacma fusca]
MAVHNLPEMPAGPILELYGQRKRFTVPVGLKCLLEEISREEARPSFGLESFGINMEPGNEEPGEDAGEPIGYKKSDQEATPTEDAEDEAAVEVEAEEYVSRCKRPRKVHCVDPLTSNSNGWTDDSGKLRWSTIFYWLGYLLVIAAVIALLALGLFRMRSEICGIPGLGSPRPDHPSDKPPEKRFEVVQLRFLNSQTGSESIHVYRVNVHGR